MAGFGQPFVLKQRFETPENLEKAVAEYFQQCKKNKKPTTIERLAEFLDCSDRTLTRYKEYYEKYEKFSDNEEDAPQDFQYNEEKVNYCRPIKKAYQRIKAEDIERLKERGNAGDIFIAKNHGYTDSQKIEHGGKINSDITIIKIGDDEVDF
jgi:hypothetical protein